MKEKRTMTLAELQQQLKGVERRVQEEEERSKVLQKREEARRDKHPRAWFARARGIERQVCRAPHISLKRSKEEKPWWGREHFCWTIRSFSPRNQLMWGVLKWVKACNNYSFFFPSKIDRNSIFFSPCLAISVLYERRYIYIIYTYFQDLPLQLINLFFLSITISKNCNY